MSKDKKSVNLPPEVEELIKEYLEARDAASRWDQVAREKRLDLMAIINASGYDTDPHRLKAKLLKGLAGNTAFEVRPRPTTRLDQSLLKADYPEIFLACLKRTVSYSFVVPDVKDDGDGE